MAEKSYFPYIFQELFVHGGSVNTFEICRLIREAPKELLSSSETLVILTMALIGNRDGKDIRPGNRMLSEYTRLTKKTIIGILKSLTYKNVLICCRSGGNGNSENSSYEINIEILEKSRTHKTHIQKKSLIAEPGVLTTPPPSVITTPPPVYSLHPPPV